LEQSIENGSFHPDGTEAVLETDDPESDEIIIRETWTSRSTHENYFNDLIFNNRLQGIRHIFTDLSYTYTDNLSSNNKP